MQLHESLLVKPCLYPQWGRVWDGYSCPLDSFTLWNWYFREQGLPGKRLTHTLETLQSQWQSHTGNEIVNADKCLKIRKKEGEKAEWQSANCPPWFASSLFKLLFLRVKSLIFVLFSLARSNAVLSLAVISTQHSLPDNKDTAFSAAQYFCLILSSLYLFLLFHFFHSCAEK